MRLIRPFTLFFVLCCYATYGIAQSYDVVGEVTDSKGNGLIGVSVVIEGTTQGAVTKIDGSYSIPNLSIGKYVLSFSSIGYENQSQEINVDSKQLNLHITVLLENASELDELVVYGKSEATVLREQAYAVEVVEMKGFKNLASSGNDILARISGVNIRQSGGVGSDFTLSLNGLSGNQLRMFLDGVPMDYFGSSLTLNNFSANLLERVEVYKGVVPIHLSSDALGGAINIVTNQNTSSYIDASYSIGSYGTHIASLNSQYRNEKNGFTAKLLSFYNYSDNNYSVPVKLINEETRRENDYYTDVEHFHDAYESRMAWVQTGVTKTKYADQLLIGVMYSDNYDEVQQSPNAIGEAKTPYGEVTQEESKIITNFTYSKKGLFTDKFSFNTYLVGVFSEYLDSDYSDYRYDWFRNKELASNQTTGEIENRKTLFTLNVNNYLGRVNAEYEFNDNNNLAVNYSLNYLKLQGEDQYKAENNTQFNIPSEVNKQIVAFSYTNSSLDGKLKNTAFAKYYDYQITSQETNFSGTDTTFFKINREFFGYGISSTLKLEKLQIKASFEKAIRFPETIELFGDGLNTTNPNPDLLPEESNNYNIGVTYSSFITTRGLLKGGVNTFIRDSENFINPYTTGMVTTYVNNARFLTRGVDVSTGYVFNHKIIVSLNGTYIYKIDNNKWLNDISGNENPQYKARAPNEPYLFANASVTYRKENILGAEDNLSITLFENYVHEYFYLWENLADPDNKNVIPRQWTTNVEAVYSIKSGKYNISAGVVNLFDKTVFDNFQQQLPGRVFNLKLRYFLNKL